MKRLSGLGGEYVRERPLRALLVATSVVLGVGVLVGIGTGVATVNRGVDRLGGGIGDAQIVAAPSGMFGTRFSASVANDLAALDGVRTAAPVFAGLATISTSTGTSAGPSVRSTDAALVGMPTDRAALLVDHVADGRLPSNADEVAVSQELMDAVHAHLGGAISVGPSAKHVVGVFLGSGLNATVGRSGIVLGAPELVGSPDPALVLVDLAPGLDRSAWIHAHDGAVSGVALTDAASLHAPLRDLFAALSVGLGAVSLLTIGLAGFLIYLALSAAVAQRERDYGILFALGANRRQVAGTVVAEGLLFGVVGSVIGVLVGLGLARGFATIIALLFHLPSQSLVVAPASIVGGVALGVVVSVIGAIVPARRASRSAPAAAIRADATTAPTPRWRPLAGTALVLIGIAQALLFPVNASPLGTIAMLVGLLLALPAVIPYATRVLRPIARRVTPGVGELALEHLNEDRHRLASTAGLVTAVLIVVVSTGASYQSLEPQMRHFMQAEFGSDLQVFSAGLGATPLPTDFADRVRANPAVAAVSPMWHANVRADGDTRQRIITVIDPATYFATSDFNFAEGDRATARAQLDRGGGVLVNYAIALENGWHARDRITLRVGANEKPLQIIGFYSAFGDDYARAFIVGTHDGQQLMQLQGPNEVRIAAAPGADLHELAADLPAIGQPLSVKYGADNVNQAMRQFNGVFSMFLVIMLIGGIVGLLGVVNALAISVLQRRREVGLLRAIGTRAREVRRMVLAEAVLVVGLAFAIAVPLSIASSLSTPATGKSVFGFNTSNHYPVTWLPIILVLTIIGGVLAGLGPAARAIRLDPITTLREE